MNQELSKKIKTLSFLLIIQIVLFHARNIDFFYFNKTDNLSAITFINYFFQYFIAEGLAKTALSLFFAISGYLFFHNFNQFSRFSNFYVYKINRRIFTLIIPYLIWSFWGILMYFIFLIVGHRFFGLEVRPFIIDVADLFNKIFISPIPGQLWYIRELVIYALFTPLLLFLIKRLRLILLGFLFLMWFLEIDLLYFISEKGLFFYSLGLYSALFLDKIVGVFQIGNKKYRVLASVWIVLIFFSTINQILFWSEYNFYLINLSIIVGLLPTWFIYEQLGIIIKERIRSLSKHTFFLYAAHLPTIAYINKAIAKITSNDYSSLLSFLLVPPILVFCLLIISEMLSRYTPFIYRLATGSRNK